MNALVATLTIMLAAGTTRPEAPSRLRELVPFPHVELTAGISLCAPGDAAREEPSLDELTQALEAGPRTADLLARYGDALRREARLGEAEAALREAVRLRPDAWRAWSALGEVLAARAAKILEEKTTGASSGEPERPDPSILDTARHLLSEAESCHDKAVGLAPEEPEAMARRANYHACQALAVIGTIAALTGQSALLVPEAARRDYRRLAELRPDDPVILGRTALVEFLVAASQLEGTTCLVCRSFEELPEDSRNAIRSRMQQLGSLGEPSDPRPAAVARRMLAFLNAMILEDPGAAFANIEESLRLDPRSADAWQAWIALVPDDASRADRVAARRQEILENCAEPACILAVAKALDLRGNARGALELVQKVLLRWPGNATAWVARAALHIRIGDPTWAAREALEQASTCGARERESLRRGYAFTFAVVAAMSGQPEQAREVLKEILAADPEDARAAEALSLLPAQD
jgi:Flp pilus assembly protein TadD